MFYFITQTVREGNREYTSSWTEEANSVEELEREYNEDCYVDFDNMEIYTEDIDTRTMTQQEFDIVSRFL